MKRRDVRSHLLTAVKQHVDLLKGYGLDCYLSLYVDALSQKYTDLSKSEVKGI